MDTKRKKLLLVLCAAVLVLAFSSTAFAGTIEDPGSANTGTQDNTIPTYGYVGPDAHIVPGASGGGPTVTLINASIPTEMLWAAFSSDFTAGSASVKSANHYVQLNTGSAGVNLILQNFSSAGGDALPVSATLALTITPSSTAGSPTITTPVIAVTPTFVTPIPIATMRAGDKVNLKFGGTYADTGTFPAAALMPKYNTVLRMQII